MGSESHLEEVPQTVMLLTEEEWEYVAGMVQHYRNCTEWATRPESRRKVEFTDLGRNHLARLDRERALALRIIKACDD